MSSQPIEQLTIRTISTLTGVHPVTLRAWERRYGLIRPLRTPKGHRLYTHGHVERIRRALALVERGVPISRVCEALDADTTQASPRTAGPWSTYVEQMASAVARFDERELDRVYDEALSVHPVERVTQQLVRPLLRLLGERWRVLEGAVAEEHFFAMYLRSKLGARLQHRMRYAEGPRLLTACAPGEFHEIGLLLFALEAQAAGLRTVLLGADTPLEELAVAQQRARCDGVVLSSSMDPAPGVLDDALPRLVRHAGVPVFIGGATAVRRAAAIAAAGAIALGSEIEDGLRLILRNVGGESR
jgi:DNA-binding transcriptional MerR regulator